jgi:hypothetical protein
MGMVARRASTTAAGPIVVPILMVAFRDASAARDAGPCGRFAKEVVVVSGDAEL